MPARNGSISRHFIQDPIMLRSVLNRTLPAAMLAISLLTAACGGTDGGAGAGSPVPTATAAAVSLVSLTVATSGNGTVTSNPSGISCGTSCSASFTAGTAVTLTAEAASGYTFNGWSGGCSGTASCSLNLATAVSVTATFTAAAVTDALSIRASGGKLVDGKGNTVQLRGVNVSGLESVAIRGTSPANPWGAQTGTQSNGSGTPPWSVMATTWAVNAVRIPLNEASWLGLQCTDVGGAGDTVVNGVAKPNLPGTTIKADPGGNYQATVEQSVAAATAAGMYVILDLHWAAPGTDCPFGQNPFLDSDNSLPFWTSIATKFRTNPAVIFELFNEPFRVFLTSSTDYWSLWKSGGTFGELDTFGSPSQVSLSWKAPSMQQVVDAIRTTAGATNLILISGENYSGDLSEWLANVPTDTLTPAQIGAVWHAYPGYGAAVGTSAYLQPENASGDVWSEVQAIISAGYPVVITEFGDQNASASAGAPFAANLLPWADTNGVSYLAWTWDPWPLSNFVLIRDAAGDPTPGFGVYTKAHYLCRAAGTATCP
jgi:endoglucanase